MTYISTSSSMPPEPTGVIAISNIFLDNSVPDNPVGVAASTDYTNSSRNAAAFGIDPAALQPNLKEIANGRQSAIGSGRAKHALLIANGWRS